MTAGTPSRRCAAACLARQGLGSEARCAVQQRHELLFVAPSAQHVSPRCLPALQPKIAQHCNQCSASGFTCIDCSASFDRRSVQVGAGCPACCWCQAAGVPVAAAALCAAATDARWLQGHTQCVTEHEKYALGATKPGGYAAEGFAANGAAKPSQDGAQPAAWRSPAAACAGRAS